MSVEVLRWLVIVVVVYAAIAMVRAALFGRRGELRQSGVPIAGS